jgi:hypothetical protein
MSFVRGQVVENQRSVQRTARRDRTTSFFCPCGLFLPGMGIDHRAKTRMMESG